MFTQLSTNPLGPYIDFLTDTQVFFIDDFKSNLSSTIWDTSKSNEMSE